MSRPKFPSPYTILTPSMISRIRSDQAAYDRNPAAYERRERRRKEEREQEEARDREQEREAYQEEEK